MYNLRKFRFNDMMDCRARLRQLLESETNTVAEAAERIVGFFRNELVADDGSPACALVRFFKTHPYDKLDDDLKEFARAMAYDVDTHANLRCLVLLATQGDQHEWNDTRQSRGHRVIPLLSEKMVEEAPMISQLIRQLGVDITMVLRPDPGLLLEGGNASAQVFYVPKAAGSPFIVAQNEFVIPYGIESVLGCGGMLASGDLFATILFSKVPISAETADLFKIIGLNLKLAILPSLRRPLFQ